MKTQHFGIFVLALFLLSASCGPLQQLDDRSKLIAHRQDGIIRGINFDMPPDSVKMMERVEPAIEETDYLGYSFTHKDYPAETLRVDYMFNMDNQLDIIIMDYRIKDESAMKDMERNLKRYFQKKYGEPTQDELGWNTWKFKDEHGKPGTVEVVLLTESAPEYQGLKLELVKYFEGE